MPFTKDNETHITRTAFVVPIGGYGWQRLNEDGSRNNIEPLVNCQIQVLEFFRANEEPVVACGRITSGEARMINWWVTLIPVFDNAHVNLEWEACVCGTLICPQKPDFNDSIRPLNQASVVYTNSRPHYSGISIASLSLEKIKEKYNI